MLTPHTLALKTLDDVRTTMRCIVDSAEVQRHNATRTSALQRITFEDLQTLRTRFIVHVAQLAESLDHGNGAYLINALLPPAELIDFDSHTPSRARRQADALDWPSLAVDIDISTAATTNIAELSETIAGGTLL